MLLQTISAKNLLSFGPGGLQLELRPLNVLIGPNGAGKSNLLDILSLLQAAPVHLGAGVLYQGGMQDWIWKGQPGATAVLEAIVSPPPGNLYLHHSLEFGAWGPTFLLSSESIVPHRGPALYTYLGGRAMLQGRRQGLQQLPPQDLLLDQSILSQRKDPAEYPELMLLGLAYGGIRLYREWVFGRRAAYRGAQRADLPNHPLDENLSNFALFLNRLLGHPAAKDLLIEHLRDLYDGLRDLKTTIEAGYVGVSFTEGDFTIPASRLSDGSMRYLCLLAILCDPDPPPLICIEEPDLGLHPDLLPGIAQLLRSASERSQIIITTHSDILVDCFTEQPEAVVICEKHDGESVMHRLDANRLSEWLERYRLGELWTKGELGGVRW